jgi:hypothetical protein
MVSMCQPHSLVALVTSAIGLLVPAASRQPTDRQVGGRGEST